ncbi:oligosaccharide flippase family protein, partial [Desulfovibrio sp. OttesenSCG-928-F20]|nr:oligosaccharide flippase family protein [Desulfovibrio sp. OttesenSCG-928-F20]
MKPFAQVDEKTGLQSRQFLLLLSRRFGFMLCAQWGSGLLAGIFLILLARLGPEIFGLFSLAMALGVLVTMLTGAGIENYLVPLLSGERAPMRRVLGQALRIQTVLLLASLLLLALL